ncbi:MAG: ABC transporter permease [Deltaproteobacteria bacterium]|nr:ABC transporter permease [Deltaproteobacteria bacterium]
MTQPTAQPATAAPPPRRFLALREDLPRWEVLFYGAFCIVLSLLVWWFVTRGESEQRILSYTVLPSPGETLGAFSSLWFDRALTRNTVATLWRVVLGFGLAAVIGIPLGILCGCFSRVQAFFAPLSIFGRNIPVAALIPLTFSLFGIGEFQKVMLLFIASVAFVFSDTARAISDVSNQYIDTAYTLGASRRQVIVKVLVPLAMPSVFNSLRLLFGLAFGYIMLGELVTIGDAGGLGHIINVSMRRGPREHILLVLLIIPLVALAIDALLFWVQRELFPHRYKGTGFLHRGLQALFHIWEDITHAIWRRPVPPTSTPAPHHEPKQP